MKASRLFGPALRTALSQHAPGEPSLFEELRASDRERLNRLLLLSVSERINLAEGLDALFGSQSTAAQTSLRGFRKSLNDAAEDVGCAVRFVADTGKRSSTASRSCWFTGPDPAVASAETFSRDSVADIRGETMVRPRARASTRVALEQNQRVVRFFVSYSHADKKAVDDLLHRLKTKFAAAGSYYLDPWVDRWEICPGDTWTEEIAAALDDCDMGLLFLSDSFFASEFIRDNELPRFLPLQAGASLKPCMPIAVKEVDRETLTNRGVVSLQIFRRQLANKREPMSYLGCRAEFDKEDFVSQLFRKMCERLERGAEPVTRSDREEPGGAGEFAAEKALDAGHGDSQSALSTPDDVDDELREWTRDSVRHFQRTRARTTSFDELERLDGQITRGEDRDALNELHAWATNSNPESPVFCAVLGEYGIGKTTTLKQFTQDLLDRRAAGEDAPLPIYIDLRLRLGESTAVPTLDELLTEVIRRNTRLREASALTPAEILRLVREEGAVVIFDGLDEKIVHLPPSEARAFIRELWRALPPIERKQVPPHGDRRGRLLLSCRSHYFRDVLSQNAMLTGEDREGIRRDDYKVLLMLPFSEDQIRGYLRSVLGAESRAEEAFELIESIHDLRDLAERPVLLSHITEHLAELERHSLAGQPVNAARLYGMVVDRWLWRDDGKHQIDPAHKRLLMERLAGKLAAEGRRELDAESLEFWLDEFLAEEPIVAGAYGDKPRAVLKEDLRTATFVVRPESGEHGGDFRFAHTSLQEYFLACHLHRALREGRPERWNLPPQSVETLDFVGQLLQIRSDATSIRTWEATLSADSLPAATLAFRLWMEATRKGYPIPNPRSVNLAGADLSEWRIAGTMGQPLNLREANLSGARLNRCRIEHVDLTGADLQRADARQAEFVFVIADAARLDDASLEGSVWRFGSAKGMSASRANLHRSEWIEVRGAAASLPPCDGTWWIGDTSGNAVAKKRRVGDRGGHTSVVWSCAWSPDGSRLLSASEDNTLRVWDAASGACLLTVTGHTSYVFSCAWSPDGVRLISASLDGTLRVWDATSGACQLTLNTSDVESCTWSPDGSRLLSGSFDNTLRVWDAASGACLLTLTGHTSYVLSCAWSPDGSRLLSASYDDTLRVWDAASGACLLILTGHTASVRSCAWSPDGSRLLSASEDKTLREWDAASGACLLILTGHAFSVHSCAWSPDGSRLLSASTDKTLRVWDAASGACLLTLTGHTSSVWSCAWSPDGSRLLSGSRDNTLRVWDAAGGACLLTLAGHASWVRSCAWSPDGSRLLSASEDGTLRVRDAASGACLLTLTGHTSSVWSCAWSPDGSRLLSASQDRLRVWDAASGACLLILTGHTASVQSCAWSPDGSRLLSGSLDNTLRVWDAASGACLLTLTGHTSYVGSCAWSPDGSRLLSASDDHTLRMWDAASGACLLTLNTSSICSCAWSPEGSRLLSASFDNTLRVWDAASGACLLTLTGHTSSVRSCAWSPDGSRLLSASEDHTLRVWDAAIGACLLTVMGHTSVRSCAWSPDGSRLLSASDDGTLRVWDAASGACLAIHFALPELQSATVAGDESAFLSCTPDAWRWLCWREFDANGVVKRLLPAEAYGPLPVVPLRQSDRLPR